MKNTPAPFADADAVIAWLDSLGAPGNVQTARLLADGSTAGAIAAYADATVYELTRASTYPKVAAALGTTIRSVERAVGRHLARGRAEAA